VSPLASACAESLTLHTMGINGSPLIYRAGNIPSYMRKKERKMA
jgi:hypothetical protein